MIRLRITLNNLPTNSKRILEFLEYTTLPAGEVTMTNVGRKLGLNYNQIRYATGYLRKLGLIKQHFALGGKMSAKLLSVNADTVARSDIKEMIHNV